jgi:hypothetical protein
MTEAGNGVLQGLHERIEAIVEVSCKEGVATIALIGELHIFNPLVVRRAFQRLPVGDITSVHVDDSRLVFIDADRTWDLVDGLQRLVARGVEVKLRPAHAVLRQRLELLWPGHCDDAWTEGG